MLMLARSTPASRWMRPSPTALRSASTAIAEQQFVEADGSLGRFFAPWVRELGLRVVPFADAPDGVVRAKLLASAPLVHGGNVVCGQALFAAADSLMVCALVKAQVDGLAGTLQAQISFLKPIVPGGEVLLTARVLRTSKSTAYGIVDFTEPVSDRLCGQATLLFARRAQ